MQPLSFAAQILGAPPRDVPRRHHRRTSTLQTIYDFLRPPTAQSARSIELDAASAPLLRPPSPPTPWRSRASAPSTPGSQPPRHVEASFALEAKAAVVAQRALYRGIYAFEEQLRLKRWVEHSLRHATLVPTLVPRGFVDGYGQPLPRPLSLTRATQALLEHSRTQLAALEANGSRDEMCASVKHLLGAFAHYYELLWRLFRNDHPWVARLVFDSREGIVACLFDNPVVGPRRDDLSLQPFSQLLFSLQASPLGSERLHRLLLGHWEQYVAGLNATAQLLHTRNNRAVTPHGTLPALLHATGRHMQTTERLRASLRGERAISFFSDDSDS